MKHKAMPGLAHEDAALQLVAKEETRSELTLECISSPSWTAQKEGTQHCRVQMHPELAAPPYLTPSLCCPGVQVLPGKTGFSSLCLLISRPRVSLQRAAHKLQAVDFDPQHQQGKNQRKNETELYSYADKEGRREVGQVCPAL